MKQHNSNTPDFKFSQPRSMHPQGILKQARWSFDEAHPAIAADHCLRTREQDHLLKQSRQAAALKMNRASFGSQENSVSKISKGLKVQ